jgi:hypothetical protein
MAEEDYYNDEEFLDDEEFDEEEGEFMEGGDLPWWVRKAPPLLISGGFHAILLLIAAYIITTYITRQEQITILAKREHKEPEYNPDIERAIFQRPEILADKIVERPIVMLEEEIEITKDIPRGTSFDNLSNKNLNSTSVVDAYGVGGGAAGAYGQRWAKGSLETEGGGPPTESAVLAGLRWLHFHQDKPKGNWDVDDYQRNCKGPGSPCSHMNNGQPPAATFDAGVSGLALLAFLGYGQTHRVGKFKRTVRRGLKYLKGVQQASGCFGHTEGESWIYNHALGTMAMCEAYAVTRDNILKGPAQKAIDYMVQAQNPGYGWKYEPRSGKSDTSVTGWMVLALKAAKMGKLVIPQSAFDGAIAWFDRMTLSSGGRAGKVGYMRPGDNGAKLAGRPPDTFKSMPTMTSVAVLCRIFCGQKRAHKKIQQGVSILMKNLPDWNKPRNDKVNFYYWYYGTYAMFQVGGPKWKTWNEAMKKALLKTQRAGRICQDGSWDPVGEWCIVGGRCYATAINVLTLEIYYRHARANLRGNRG